jgi:DNA helicase-2/ATP-dependent DNA helicase PcrA
MFDTDFTEYTEQPQATATPLPLDHMNAEQRQAVEAIEGPLLVLAGAGTGKTRVLTTRIANILHRNLAFPGQILSVTFTNKAAAEMRHRVEEMVGPQAGGIWLGTFHSICTKILRRHAELLGFKSSFTIIDTDDQIRLLKQLLEEQNIDPKRWPPKQLISIIQGFKDRGLTPDKLSARDGKDFGPISVAKLYSIYQTRMKQLGAMDFGDLLLYTLVLFNKHPDVLAEYHRRFRYILVDEYQDTNTAQYLWLRLLSQEHHNICCVGDDDQSIYGWRGAEVGNILKFEKDYPEAKTIRLERNYRSTKDILATASALIAYNKERLGKTLWTEQEESEKVRIISVWDEKHEAQTVGEEIEALQHKGLSDLNDVAILVRAGFQTRAFEEAFIAMSIPYRVIGGLRFYERMEIRDAIAYLRLIQNPSDDLAFERIINVPKRGLGKSTLDKIRSNAREQNISLFTTMTGMLQAGAFKGKMNGTLQALVDRFTDWRERSQTLGLNELAEDVLEQSGYLALWQKEKTPEAEGRLENLKELIAALEDFDTLATFLEHVSLVTDADAANDNNMVNIMTLHAAKGLEFSTVFLPGWEEGLFPHQRALDENGTDGLEEERRLGYVGITRARKKLTISFAANRRIYNQWQSSLPSRFIDELPKEHVEITNMGTNFRSSAGEPIRQVYERKPAIHHASQQATPSRFSKGTRIFHQKFGYGRVRTQDGNHLTIAFDKAGVKTVLEDYVKKA